MQELRIYDFELIGHNRRCKELWKVVPSRQYFLAVWVLHLEELLAFSCQVYVGFGRSNSTKINFADGVGPALDELRYTA